jgi:hypothetical protein
MVLDAVIYAAITMAILVYLGFIWGKGVGYKRGYVRGALMERRLARQASMDQ